MGLGILNDLPSDVNLEVVTLEFKPLPLRAVCTEENAALLHSGHACLESTTIRPHPTPDF